jgi:phospholipid-binding lipoprotein MlaA
MERFRFAACIVAIMVMSGCASSPERDPRDPFEPINRPLWTFNQQVLDRYILRPTAVGYSKIPDPARNSVNNFFLNLEEPGNSVNHLLQGKFSDSGKSLLRFVINSTVGVLGLFDPATGADLPRKRESLGQTMGKWGLVNGPFLMVPAMGPSTVRNTAGNYGDTYIFPLNSLSITQLAVKFVMLGLETRISAMDQEDLLAQSLDSYVFIREAYLQNDEYNVLDGNVETEEEEYDDFDDFDDYDDSLE